MSSMKKRDAFKDILFCIMVCVLGFQRNRTNSGYRVRKRSRFILRNWLTGLWRLASPKMQGGPDIVNIWLHAHFQLAVNILLWNRFLCKSIRKEKSLSTYEPLC